MVRRRRRRRHALQSARKLPLARRMGFSVLVLAAALTLIEAGVRLGMAEPTIPSLSSMHRGTAMEPHPTRMWTLRRDMTEQFGAPTQVNEQGLRAVQTTAAPLKILTLGDSSIFGHALAEEDTLHAQLREALGVRGVEVDVLCGGIPGYSTEQTLLLLDEVGWELEPDLIVIGTLWSDNNLDHFVDAEWMALLNSPVSRFDWWMRSWSRAWRIARTRTSPQVSAIHGAEFSPVGWIRDPEPEGRRRVPPSDYAKNLDRILVEAERRGVGALMFQPVNPERLTGEIDRSAWGAYFEIQRGIATRRSVPVLDGLESLQASGMGTGEAFLDDLHPTGAANRVYAEVVAELLVDSGWPGVGLIPDSGPSLYDKVLSDPWMEGTGGPGWRSQDAGSLGVGESLEEESRKALVTPDSTEVEDPAPEQAWGPMMDFVLPAAIVLFAGAVQGVIGFGAGLVGMSLLVLIWDLSLAVAVGAVFSLPMVCYVAWRTREALSVAEVAPLALGCIVGIPIGVAMLVHVDPRWVKGLLGLVLVGHGGWSLMATKRPNDVTISRKWGPLAGVFSGLLSGALNASGPPVVIYGTERGWEKDAFRGNLAVYFFVTSLITVVALTQQGLVSALSLGWNLKLFAPFLAGVVIGDRVSAFVEPNQFRRAVLYGLLGTGVYYLFIVVSSSVG